MCGDTRINAIIQIVKVFVLKCLNSLLNSQNTQNTQKVTYNQIIKLITEVDDTFRTAQIDFERFLKRFVEPYGRRRMQYDVHFSLQFD